MPEVKSEKYVEAVGKRKTAVARVRILKATKNSIEVNDKPAGEYFKGEYLTHIVREPLVLTESTGKHRITVHVSGGGPHAQAQAVAMGMARALTAIDKTMRAPLKKAKLLTRDARIKERRKFGLKKARKAPQWSKR